jgi:hypothetical protein
MAQYWEDWAEQTIDTEPVGWTKRFSSSAITYTIKEDAEAPSGKSLKIVQTSTARRAISWDLLDADSNRATVSIRALVRHNAPTPSASTPYIGLMGRGAGAAATETGVVAFMGHSPTTIRISNYSSGTLTTSVQSPSTGIWSVGSEYWLGIDLNGDDATITLAPSNDPNNPSYTAAATTPGVSPSGATGTGNVTILTAGWVGLFTFSVDSNIDILAIGAGTNGDSAPTHRYALKGSSTNQLLIASGTLSVHPRLYYVIYPAAKATPSAVQIKAGLDVDNTAAVAYGSEISITTTGEQIFSSAASGLSPSTSYKIAAIWWNGITDSNVSVSGDWSTLGSNTNKSNFFFIF